MKKTILIMLTLALGTLLIAQTPCNSGARQMKRDGNHEYRNKDRNCENYNQPCGMCDNLDLSDAQKEQITNLKKELQLKMIDLRAEKDKLRVQLQDARQNNDFNKAKELSNKMFTKKGEIAKIVIEHQEKVYNLLTKEQKEQLKSEKHKPSMRKHNYQKK
jgi:Spy/CpxP family protein refolding chaperone